MSASHPILDANRVAGCLWMGAFPHPGDWSYDFDCLVLSARERQPPSNLYLGSKVLHIPLDDDVVTPVVAKAIAAAAKDVRRWLDTGKIVLVTCNMGLNRSGVICAMTLMLPKWGRRKLAYETPSGMRSYDAIAAVRRARGVYGLSNPHFVNLLNRFPHC